MAFQEKQEPFNIRIVQGADYSLQVTLEDASEVAIDITGYTINAEIRKNHESAVTETFTVVLTTPASGVFTISLTNIETAALDFNNDIYRYDVYTTDLSSIKERVLHGNVVLEESITQ